jgi:hypothetical protein
MIMLFGVLIFGACSKPDGNESGEKKTAKKSEAAMTDQPVTTNQTEDEKAIEQALIKLKNPDKYQQIRGIKELRNTYTPEACGILIELLKQKTLELPDSLDESMKKPIMEKLSDGKEAPATVLLLEYIGVLLERIRAMNQPNGNQSVTDFMEMFRLKYGKETLGASKLKAYESQLRNVEIDIKEGLYNKNVKPVQGLTN